MLLRSCCEAAFTDTSLYLESEAQGPKPISIGLLVLVGILTWHGLRV